MVETLNVDINYDGIADINVDTDGDGTADFNVDADGDGIPDNFNINSTASIENLDPNSIFLGLNVSEVKDIDRSHIVADLWKGARILNFLAAGGINHAVYYDENGYNALGYPYTIDPAYQKIEAVVNNSGVGDLVLLVEGNTLPIDDNGIVFRNGLTLNSSADLGGGIYQYNLSSDPNSETRIIELSGVFTLDPIAARISLYRDRSDATHLGSEVTKGFADFVTNSTTGSQTAYATLRYMEWTATNIDDPQEFTGVARPAESASYFDAVPLEVIRNLTNSFDQGARPHPWVCVHHRVHDPAYESLKFEYLSFLTELLDNDPSIKVYVELSNEKWNGQFPQTSWYQEQGAIAFVGTPSETHGTTLQGLEYAALKTSEFLLELRGLDPTGNGYGDRVIGVFGGQAANVWASSAPLRYDWRTDSPSHADMGINAVAIAPYFGGYIGAASNLATLLEWRNDPDGGVSKVFQEITEGGLLPNSRPGGALADAEQNVIDHYNYTSSQGLKLLAYEAGQHLVGVGAAQSNSEVTALLEAVNRDPRMEGIYRNYLARIKSAGVEVLTHFRETTRHSQFGFWGLLENVYDSPEVSPKYRAWKEYVDASQLRGVPNNI